MPEFAVEASAQSVLARYVGADHEVDDAVLGSQEAADMRLGRLNLRYVVEGDPRDAFCTMGLARVIERRSTGAVVLDEAYIPPMLECAPIATCAIFSKRRATWCAIAPSALSGRLNQSTQKGVGEISEFLMLQIANRFDPWLAHLARRETLHPEALYTVLLQLAGEMATFSARRKRRATDFAAYRHDDLRGSFEPLMVDIRDLLTEVINPNAINIPLQERAKGLYTGMIPDLELIRTRIVHHGRQCADQQRSAAPAPAARGEDRAGRKDPRHGDVASAWHHGAAAADGAAEPAVLRRLHLFRARPPQRVLEAARSRQAAGAAHRR